MTFCLKWRQNIQKLSPRPEKLRVARVARDMFSNRMFCDLRKFSRRALLWLNCSRHVVACHQQCRSVRLVFLKWRPNTLHCFRAFSRIFLGTILLITKVDCRRTSVAAFLSQRVASSGFLRKEHFQVCRVARTGEKSHV